MPVLRCAFCRNATLFEPPQTRWAKAETPVCRHHRRLQGRVYAWVRPTGWREDPQPQTERRQRGVRFQYVGPTRVRGSVCGRIWVFERPGARPGPYLFACSESIAFQLLGGVQSRWPQTEIGDSRYEMTFRVVGEIRVGPEVPIVIEIGGARSQEGVRIALE